MTVHRELAPHPTKLDLERKLREQAAKGRPEAITALAQLGVRVDPTDVGTSPPGTPVTVDRGAHRVETLAPAIAAQVALPDRFVGMTRTERLWAEQLDRDPTVVLWQFESVTLVLGDNVRYTPDFLVLTTEGRIRFDEVKQRWWGLHNKPKIRMAATRFPFFHFQVALKPKGATAFTLTTIPPR